MSEKRFRPGGLATAIGSMPHTNPVEACDTVLRYLTEIPAWPQLPHRSFRENMYVQYSEGLPGVVVEADRIYIDRSADLTGGMEELYRAYIENDIDRYAISPGYAAGLEEFLSRGTVPALAVKGQVTGPISFGLAVTDQDRRPVLYDEALADAVARHLRLKAAWMERELARLSPGTIIFLDEPYLTSLGSAYVALDNETVVRLVNEAVGGLRGLKGMHCCGNTDWSVLMSTDIDILNFDAMEHGESLALYAAEVEAFLARGGILAWGIVPNVEKSLDGMTSEIVLESLERLMGLLENKGVSRQRLTEGCMITPSCSLASMTVEDADKALQLLAEVSRGFRSRYGPEGN